MLDDIIELILELFMEGISSVVENSRVSKWIRIPLLLVIVAAFVGLIVFLMYQGVTGMDEEPLCLLYIALAVVFIGLLIWYLMEVFRKK